MNYNDLMKMYGDYMPQRKSFYYNQKPSLQEQLESINKGVLSAYQNQFGGMMRPPRRWGESRRGEFYTAVEGAGNPSWERRNPMMNTSAKMPVTPTQPIGAGYPVSRQIDGGYQGATSDAQRQLWSKITRPWGVSSGGIEIALEGPGRSSWESSKWPEFVGMPFNEVMSIIGNNWRSRG